MNNIRFSHKYPKLWKQDTAELVCVRIVEMGCVGVPLTDYDTTYEDGEGIGHYPLPDCRLLQLIFVGNYDIPFCTLRRWTGSKEIYYRSKVGAIFNIIIGDN